MPMITPRHTATILAALRYWQQDLEANEDPPICEDFRNHSPLSSEEIETLCEELELNADKCDQPSPFIQAPAFRREVTDDQFSKILQRYSDSGYTNIDGGDIIIDLFHIEADEDRQEFADILAIPRYGNPQ